MRRTWIVSLGTSALLAATAGCATKGDLTALEGRLDRRLGSLEQRVDTVASHGECKMMDSGDAKGGMMGGEMMKGGMMGEKPKRGGEASPKPGAPPATPDHENHHPAAE
jgi:hypothetical protein